MKKLYIYEGLDRIISGGGDAHHQNGGLIVITSGYPDDAVPGVGIFYTIGKGGDEKSGYRLPEATRVIKVSDTEPDAVIAFPDAGCC